MKSDWIKPVLILGIGNILMKDEGFGVHVVRRLDDTSACGLSDVEILDGGTTGYDLLPHMQNRKKIYIIDTLSTDDAPGAVYRFKPEDAYMQKRGFSLHSIGIMNVINALKMTGDVPEIEIIGIVPEDISTMEIGLSFTLENSMPEVVSLIMKELSRKAENTYQVFVQPCQED